VLATSFNERQNLESVINRLVLVAVLLLLLLLLQGVTGLTCRSLPASHA
jgi:hypothetical protein